MSIRPRPNTVTPAEVPGSTGRQGKRKRLKASRRGTVDPGTSAGVAE